MEELVRISTDGSQKSVFDEWYEKTGGKKNDDWWFMRDMVRHYGPDLVRWAIDYLPSPPFPQGEPKQFFIEFLYYTALGNTVKVDQLLRNIASDYETDSLSRAPAPRDMRINRYFWAVAGRAPSDEESCLLWELTAFFAEIDIIFEITAIPINEFNILKLDRALQKHFRKQNLPMKCAYWRNCNSDRTYASDIRIVGDFSCWRR
jgi:hypothetical protein